MSEPTSDADDYPVSESVETSSSDDHPVAEEVAAVADRQVAHHGHSASRPGPAGWIAPLALVISLLAAGAAGWTLLKPATPADTSAASADPKGEVCTAFKTVSTGIFRYSHADPNGEPGLALAAAQEAVAANARLAMSGGATYLLRNLSSNTPTELADAVRGFAGTIDTVAMKLLSGIPNSDPAMVDLLKSTDESSKKITELCK